MKRLVLPTILTLSLLVLASWADSQPKPAVQASQLNAFSGQEAFSRGEHLKYYIRWGIFRAMEVHFRINQNMPAVAGKRVLHISGTGESTSAVDVFFKIRDKHDSYVDPNTMLPLKYVRSVREGDYEFDDVVYFDYEAGKIKGNRGQFDMQGRTFGMLSALYYARTLDLRSMPNGTIVNIPIFMDDKIYDTGMRIVGRETISTRAGKFRCVKIEPRLIDGRVFSEDKDPMVIWVTDDDNQLPVRIESPIAVGSIKVDLVEYENLRNATSAKIR